MQASDQLPTRPIALVGIGLVAITMLAVAIAWLLVRPAVATRAPSQPSPLQHDLFDRASDGADSRMAGLHALGEARWVDRTAHVARIPIDLAIDAVVADPALIGAPTAHEARR